MCSITTRKPIQLCNLISGCLYITLHPVAIVPLGHSHILCNPADVIDGLSTLWYDSNATPLILIYIEKTMHKHTQWSLKKNTATYDFLYRGKRIRCKGPEILNLLALYT